MSHNAVRTRKTYVEDLAGELASRAHNQDEWLSTNTVGERVVANRVGARSSQLASLAHELGQDGNEEGTSLAGA
jgi:hypothetical protein